jgi:type IV fimbrial biogenesis protein FimT
LLTERVKPVAGFTLIEMLVTIVIFGVLAALTVPSMQVWMANTRVRAVADSLQNGLRLAQAESLRRSRQVVFALTNDSPNFQSPAFTAAAAGVNWAVVTIPVVAGETSEFIQSGVLATGVSNVTVSVANGSGAEVCFNSVGRLVSNSATGVPGGTCSVPAGGFGANTQPMLVYQVQMTNGSTKQLTPLYVEVALGGQVHLCDPSQATNTSGNSYGC